jgi:hypothetical protein
LKNRRQQKIKYTRKRKALNNNSRIARFSSEKIILMPAIWLLAMKTSINTRKNGTKWNKSVLLSLD